MTPREKTVQGFRALLADYENGEMPFGEFRSLVAIILALPEGDTRVVGSYCVVPPKIETRVRCTETSGFARSSEVLTMTEEMARDGWRLAAILPGQTKDAFASLYFQRVVDPIQ